MDITGTNIVNKIDFQLLAKNFVDYFFSCWKSGNRSITTIIDEHTRLKYRNNVYKGEEQIISLLFSLAVSGINFEISDINAMESGSRRIDIMVNGFICNSTNVKHRLSIFFLITYQNESWKLQNSILNIFI